MKNIKKIIKSAFIILFSCFLLILPIFFRDISHFLDVSVEKDNMRLLIIWHCETFEGGKQSRFSYLKNIASEFEKANKGIVVYVRLVEVDEMESLLAQGQKPDLLSFGSGISASVASSLIELNDEYGVRDNFVESARVDKRLLALPYMVSGYAYISTGENIDKSNFVTATLGRAVYSQDVSTQPLSSYQAYLEYKQGRAKTLLGTMRDIARLDNAGVEYYSEALPYTNLAQYIAKGRDGDVANLFINKLFSISAQSVLREVGLFSPIISNLYTAKPYVEIEKTLNLLTLERLW